MGEHNVIAHGYKGEVTHWLETTYPGIVKGVEARDMRSGYSIDVELDPSAIPPNIRELCDSAMGARRWGLEVEGPTHFLQVRGVTCYHH